MKNKIWTKTAFYLIIFGWFAMMWVCAWGSWQPLHIRLIITLSSVMLCMFGAFMMQPILNDDFLFRKSDELEEAKRNYIEATKRLEKKIREL